MRIPPTHKAFDAYEATLAKYHEHRADNEGAVRFAFQTLLNALLPAGWVLLGEQTLPGGIRPDGVVQDVFFLKRGYWEAKDTHDDLDGEIRNKIKRGYPLTNTIFGDTRRAVLYQDKQRAMDVDLKNRRELADLLVQFLSYEEPDIAAFGTAVEEFKDRIPELADGLRAIIAKERVTNLRFNTAFDTFRTLCRASIDPHITDMALDEMLIQHLLTERLFRTIFDNAEFTKRNVIAAEIERVIDALTSRAFSRADFLRSLDRYYRSIEQAADHITAWTDKQAFLNTVYERFFQGFSTKQADTHGIVYTPQEIVAFMCNSVEEVLRSEFGLSLASPGVAILDPATGTGNFIVNLMRRISPLDLKRKYANELFANEIMLLPYYIASMNIEHEYYVRTEEYAPFDGLCFADTLDMAQSPQLGLFTETNTARVQREKDAPITVIIGNPPYNVGQKNENDNNKNRRYKDVDARIRQTYAKDSTATLQTKIYDAYAKFFRWASDRLQGRDGIVCLISNNSFVHKNSFDGMRKHLLQDFTRIYHLDLRGDVQLNPKLSGTMYNVFGIQVGVGITLAIRNSAHTEPRLSYYSVPETWRRTEKLDFLKQAKTLGHIAWQEIHADVRHTWLTEGMHSEYDAFIPLGTKQARSMRTVEMETIFKTYSLGVSTNRDRWVYDFSRSKLTTRMKQFIENYNSEVSRWIRAGEPDDIDAFVRYEQLKWSNHLKDELKRKRFGQYREAKIQRAMYRPFCKRLLYYDTMFNDGHGSFDEIFPPAIVEAYNQLIAVSDQGYGSGSV